MLEKVALIRDLPGRFSSRNDERIMTEIKYSRFI